MASSSSRDPSMSVLRKLQKFKQNADQGDAGGRRPQSRRASINNARPLPPPKDELLMESSQHSHTQLPKHAAPQNSRLVPNTYHRPEGMRKEDWILICTDKLRSKDQTIDDLKAKVLKLDHVRKRLEEDLHGREDEINKMQESVFQNISETRWQPLDDAVISNDLMLLQSSIARFAKSYAIEGSKAWPNERLVQLMEALRSRNVAIFRSTQELSQLIELRYGPRLCLSGLLSAAVHAMVFTNPFFFLADHPQDITPAYIFEDLRKRASINHVKEANIWRSDTLRLFSLLRNEGVEGDHQNADQSIKEGIADACDQAIADLEMGPIKFLLPQMESSTREAYTRAIRAIFEQAAQSAMRLWIQRPDIKYWGFEDLKEEPFSSDSTLLEAHNVHQLSDSDDHRLDGKAIKMVLQPAIIGMGSHEGENYDQTRVWAKAFVLVDESDLGASE